MPPKSNVPIRICGSKVRTGCRTCKGRHLKCDEGRPICLRCHKGNRQCVYDLPQPQALQRSPSPGSEAEYALSVGAHNRAYFDFSRPLVNLSPYGAHEVADVTEIKNFTTHLGKQFAGCFSQHVWCDVLPRMAQYEPCVWHGIVAVSTLQTSIRMGDDDYNGNSRLNLAIKRYGKALRELNTRLSSDQSVFCKDVILVSCILFAVFECLRSHFQPALFHISSGMKLLMEWAREAEFDKNGGVCGYLNYASLEPIFLALDTQAVQMGEVSFREFLALPGISGQLQAPVSFASAEEAYHLLNQIFNRMSRWSQWVEPCVFPGPRPDAMWMVAEEKNIRTQLYEWDFAFDTSLGLMDPTPPILLLLCQRRCIQACINKSSDGASEMVWDRGLPLFKEAVQYAEAYMELITGESLPCSPDSDKFQHSNSASMLTIAMDIVMPLFLISAKCRHPDIRRRGLRLLKTCNRKEGIWDSNLCAQIAERIIQLEEAGASGDGQIPDSARVYGIDVRLGDEKEGEVTHKKHVVSEDGRERTETHEEVMAW